MRLKLKNNMPYSIYEQNGKWILKNTDTGQVKGTHKSKADAEAQERLLNAVKHNPSFKPRGK